MKIELKLNLKEISILFGLDWDGIQERFRWESNWIEFGLIMNQSCNEFDVDKMGIYWIWTDFGLDWICNAYSIEFGLASDWITIWIEFELIFCGFRQDWIAFELNLN